MSDWKEQYLSALETRDETEKANVEIYEAYTRLADRTAQLSQSDDAGPRATDGSAPVASPPPSVIGRRGTNPASPAPADLKSTAQLRQDLAAAQQERSDLRTKLEAAQRDLESLKTRSKTDTKRITQLTTGINQMTVRIRDRDEELKGKSKLLEDVHDEVVTLNLQLNMAEDRVKKLEKENKDLVDRWMARMGKEADKMNDESKFG